jgi:hypothetical protein
MPLLETRGAASAKGFGLTAGGERVVTDWYKWVVIPYSTGTSNSYPNRVMIYNPETLTPEFDVPVSGMNSQQMQLLRVRQYLYWWAGPSSTTSVYGINLITGASVALQNLSAVLVYADIVKLGNNGSNLNNSRIATLGKSGTSLRVWVWEQDPTTGIFGLWTTQDLSGVFTASDQFNSNPQAAPAGTIADTGGATTYTYSGRVGYVGIDAYPGATYTRYLIVSIPYSGSGVSIAASQQTSTNFSRPDAGLIPSYSGGGAYLATFNSAEAFSINGSGGGFTATASLSGVNTNWGPAGLVGGNSGNRYINVISAASGTEVQLYKVGDSGTTYLAGLYTDPYGYTLCSVTQAGYNTNYGAFWTSSYQFGASNYTIMYRVQGNGGLVSLGGNMPFLSNKVINGNNAVARIVNYGE